MGLLDRFRGQGVIPPARLVSHLRFVGLSSVERRRRLQSRLFRQSAVVPNHPDKIITSGFPIEDTVTAVECDSSVVVPDSLATACDTATQITGTVAASGKVIFSPTGILVKDGAS